MRTAAHVALGIVSAVVLTVLVFFAMSAWEFWQSRGWRKLKEELTLEEKLVRAVGTADPEEIRRMLDEARGAWSPPTITRGPEPTATRELTAEEWAARLGKE